jgi:hypothetical protein
VLDGIRDKVLRRISFLYKTPVSLDDKFCVDLKSSFISDFRWNEMDLMLFDIEDIVEILKLDEDKSFSGVQTVSDFCELVNRLNEEDPRQCEMLLARWEKYEKNSGKPWWRRIFIFM